MEQMKGAGQIDEKQEEKKIDFSKTVKTGGVMRKLLLALIVLEFMGSVSIADDGTTFYYNERGESEGFSLDRGNARFYYNEQGNPDGMELRTPQPQPQEFEPVNPDMFYGKDYYEKKFND